MYRRLALLVFALATCAATRAGAQSLAATLVSPIDGSITADVTRAFSWNAVPGADMYYLYVGTAPGAKDLVDTGEIRQTMYTPHNLPQGQLLYARLWTKAAGVWRYNDSTFGRLAATLAAPVDGATAVDLSQPLQWAAVPNAQAYYVYIGTAVGLRDLADSREIQQTSYAAAGLPSGVTLYVRLWTKIGGVWRSIDSTFGAFIATLTAPQNGAMNVDLALPFQWTSVAGAQAYYLYVGTAAGSKDLIDSGELHQTSYVPRNLPTGRVLYARLWARIAGVWRFTDSTFGSMVSTFTSPADGLMTVDGTLLLQWTSVQNAQAYYLYIGTSPGAKDLVDFGETLQTSYLLRTWPRNTVIYARIWTRVGGAWRSKDITFGSFLASLTSVTDGQANVDLSQPLTWSSVPTAEAYYLYIGTSLGAKDLVDSGEITRTSYTAPNLPKGKLLYARLWTKVGGHWGGTSTTFGALISTLTSPLNGTVTASFSQPFQWTAVDNAQAYYLYVGTTQGARDLVDSGELLKTSYPPRALPVNRTLYARLWTKTGNVWRWTDSTFGSFLATLTYPIDGSSTVDLTQPFRWTTVPNAQAYYLYVGSVQGAKDLVDTGELQQTSITTRLATNQTLYARLWTKVAGAWGYTDSNFSSLMATLTYPQNGSTTADQSRQFTWSAVPNATYRLWLGTSAGGGDLADSGELHPRAYTFHGLPEGRTIYAMLGTHVGASWKYSYSTFSIIPARPLVHATDLHYEGAFRLPPILVPGTSEGFDYGGVAPAYNPLRNSLLVVSHPYDSMTAEVGIPLLRTGPVSTLNVAPVLTPFADAFGHHRKDVNPSLDPNSSVGVGGQLVYQNQLYLTSFLSYGGGQILSHFVRPVDLGSADPPIGPFRIGPLGANFYAGYMATVPAAWQVTLGPTLTGQCCLSLIGRTSYGPALFAYDLAKLGTAQDATPLVYYSEDHKTLGDWNGPGASIYFNGTTEVTGVVFPEGTSSVLFFGRHGLGPYCYGELDACPDLEATMKGDHAYPYVNYVWAYDAHDLVAVKMGTKQPWDVTPYAVWRLDLPYTSNKGHHLGGAAYDAATGRIYVTQEFADGDLPIVHVFTTAP